MAKARVLAVDDQRYFRELIEGLLCEAGYAVETAASGEEALVRLEDGAFDVVVTDLVMPGIDGAELCRQVKASRPDQDVVMVTGVADVQTAVEAMKLGATDYLLKPFDRDTLLASLDGIVERRRLREEHAQLVEENLEYLGVFSLYERAAGMFATLGVAPLCERLVEGLCLEARAQGGVIWLAEALETEAPLGLCGMRGIVSAQAPPACLERKSLSEPVREALGAGRCRTEVDGELGEVLWVPVQASGRLVGVARLSDKLEGLRFDAGDAGRAEKLAGLGGVAAINALRFRALERRSFRDPITRAYTRAYFEDVVRNEIHKASRFGRCFSLLRMRAEGIAQLRDTMTEAQQARWLEGLVERASTALRATDIVAVHDEGAFGVLLPETDSIAAAALAARVAEAVGDDSVVVDSVTHPVDGDRFEMLSERLEARIARRSARRTTGLDLSAGSLDGALRALLDRGAPLPRTEHDRIVGHLLGDFARRPQARALLFVAPPPDAVATALEQLAPFDLPRAAALRTEAVLLAPGGGAAAAERPRGGPLAVVPVERVAATLSFLVYYGDGPAYALVSDPAHRTRDGSIPFFHTDDRPLVEQLALRLQRDLGMAVPE